MEIARNKIYPFITVFLCVRDILLDRDSESDDETNRYVVLECVFSRRLQRHTTTTSFFDAHFHTHTNTHTHTHTHDWPTVADRVSGSRFFRVLQIFLTPKEGRKNFLTAKGSRNIRKYFQSVVNVFSCHVSIFYAGIMLHRFSMIRI